MFFNILEQYSFLIARSMSVCVGMYFSSTRSVRGNEVIKMYTVAPREYTSADFPTLYFVLHIMLEYISGALYRSVPLTVDGLISFSNFEPPQSASTHFEISWFNKMFSGLMSRCTIFLSCACFRALAIAFINSFTS
ncbi:hypothetical protein PBCV1_a290R [Paramecium bursaria Chlorella virus 1]|uniref:Uncharacterized protein n=1 Tax=Paramecium bursaria Chlorella virus 1 TaxID=10506 RepID=Q84606_PBCV1|nr:hypothetical protein PBCV1_a290R [Paramecium bursaria Chlorella virus 1]AAC96658.1 hypothetical protein [Paramecium bursaria Chlorella virus 1]